MIATGPITIRLVGLAVSLGFPGDPRVWGEIPARLFADRSRRARPRLRGWLHGGPVRASSSVL